MDSAYTSDGHSLLLLSDGTICKYLSGPNKRNWTFVSKKLTLGSDTQDKKLRNVKLDASIDNNSNALAWLVGSFGTATLAPTATCCKYLTFDLMSSFY